MSTTTSETKDDKWALFTTSATRPDSHIRSHDPSKTASAQLLRAAHSALRFSEATSVLDIGCGYGNVISALLTEYSSSLPGDAGILAGDNSPAMVQRCRDIKAEKVAAGEKAWERVDLAEIDACDMHALGTASRSHVLAGLVYFLTPDPGAALRETARVLAPGGVVALTSWVTNEWMELFIEVCGGVDKSTLDGTSDSMPASWRSVEGVVAQVEAADLVDVKGEAFECGMGYERAEGIVKFLGGVVPVFKDMVEKAGRFLAKDGEVEKGKDRVLGRIVEKLEARRGAGPGVMDGRAFWVVGRKPA